MTCDGKSAAKVNVSDGQNKKETANFKFSKKNIDMSLSTFRRQVRQRENATLTPLKLHDTDGTPTPRHHYTTLHYTPLNYTPLHSTTPHSTPLHYTPLHSTHTLHYTPLHSTTLHDTTLPCTTRPYTILHSTHTHHSTPLLHSTPLHSTPLHTPRILHQDTP